MNISTSPCPVESYHPPENYYDEFLDRELRPRPHWQKFADIIRSWKSDEFTRREAQLDRIIKDNGITYNVYSEDQKESRPWTMDALPLIFDSREWEPLGQALAQRARLLNLIFKDVYGPQTLLSRNLLPPYLVLANPHFCRPCHGQARYIKNPIHIYTADLARSPDGNWWVLSDRLEASSGLGYALENRSISTHIFPGVMQSLKVRRLNKFIATLCRSYESMTPVPKDNPHIVLLTSGPSSETYFEQSYLARNLGYTLVEGADLTVRDNRVYLKTISGVKEVDVIIRHVDTPWCDPLELRNESTLGVPGLIDVLRSGRVAIANALGASLLESSALPAFLPGLCLQLLGENLKIPSAATWWCGQPKEKAYVLENLENLVIRKTFHRSDGQTLFGPNLSADSLNDLRREIESAPLAFSAQEMVAQATTPIYKEGHFQSRNFILRVYLISTENGWKIMPGGLARIASDDNTVNVSMQKGGESKDVWVIGPDETDDEPIEPASAIALTQAHCDSLDLPSRVADNFFWLGRYVERAEGLARVLQNLLESLIDQGNDNDLSGLPLFDYFSDTHRDDVLSKDNPLALNMHKAKKQLSLLIGDRQNPESLISNFSRLVSAATKVKERLSTQTWQQLLKLKALSQATAEQQNVFEEASAHLLNDALDSLASFNGLMTENMTRGQNWLFLEIGKRMERMLVLLNLFHSTIAFRHRDEEEILRKLLSCADSSITYRRRYLNNLSAGSVVELLVLEKANPRSLAFQASRIQEYIRQLPHAFLESTPNKIDLIGLEVFSRINLADVQKLLECDKKGHRKNLTKFLNKVGSDITKLATKIEQRYFVHTAPADVQQTQHQQL